jgi:type IV pilus modification protein PilV
MLLPVNEKGFTLVEAMVATMVLAIGILGVIIMQTRAVSANASAFSRTAGTGLGISVLEALHALPSTDASLAPTHGAVNLMPTTVPAALADANIRRLNAATLATLPMLSNVYRVVGTAADPLVTTIVGGGGAKSAGANTYQVCWAVVDNVLPSGQIPSKTIRVYQTWGSALGGGTAVITTVK